jgi:diguanylate cyclase (GGDEF)-like protein
LQGEASGKFEPLTVFVRCWLGRLLVALVLAASPLAAKAAALRIGQTLCHAVTTGQLPADKAFSCTGVPKDYQRSTLWLRADLSRLEPAHHDPILLIHHTRFERLVVLFRYADGATWQQQAARGDYGDHWRIGGQITFEAPPRDAALIGVTMGFTGLASHELLRIRILSGDAANRDLATAAVLAGGSITLLLIGGIYNLSLAIAVRRQFLAWHGLWAVCMVLWGLLWSQITLILLPSVAGTISSQTATLLSCLAVTSATLSVVTALKPTLPRWASRSVVTLGSIVGLIGIPASLATDGSVNMYGPVLGVFVLTDLAAVVLCLGWSWRRDDGEARDLARSWAMPMGILALTQVFDFNDALFGGGPQVAVLSASALQTVWLSITTTLRLSQMRVELDRARAARSALTELANRDPLTGLLNRRGFVDCLNQTFVDGNEAPLALLLMDVDLFKTVNDQFGHEAGDAVLCRIADCLRRLERELCIAGRMGGEEFVLAVSGLSSFALHQFAERVRDTIGRCDHGEVSQHRAVTVSIGVAEGSTRTSFQKLYGAADRALYEAKHGGRNRVIFHSGVLDPQLREELERDQFSFDWLKARG